jgi:hemoglobin-like flavoprotein
MQEHQVALVKSTWLAVVPIAAQAADIFYDELFARDASLRRLFPSDLSEQKRKLMAALGRVVSSLDDLAAVLPAVEALGRQHVGYGVKPEHYATVGGALLATLQKGLGSAWNDDVKGAWSDAYGVLSNVMINASARTEAMPVHAH